MLRTRRRLNAPATSPRRGSAAGPVLFGLFCFLLVLAAFLFVRMRAQRVLEESRAVQAEKEALQRHAAARAAKAARDAKPEPAPARVDAAPKTTPVIGAPQATDAAKSVPASTSDVPVDRDPSAVRRALLEEQLAAGEFGPALETAQAATDAEERTALLQRVAQAQMQAGEYDSAAAAIRRMPLPESRTAAFREQSARKTLGGGGSGADFSALIALIQQETSGPWQDIEGTGGTISQFETGVRVDPNGLLHQLTKTEQTGRLESLGIHARNADLNTDMARPSSLRLVSLTRLERAVAERIAAGQPVLTTMQQLAGLSQVRYVFVFPEENEIVIGGPAEGVGSPGTELEFAL